ncbi:uncharacterized protein DS421_8g243590 [Arachis hypogaea]|nr:uncharacterized protein DS421_8g243590 [Arachis hypogaea]
MEENKEEEEREENGEEGETPCAHNPPNPFEPNAFLSPSNPNFFNELKAEASRNASTPPSLPLSAPAVATSRCHHHHSKLLSPSSSSGGPFEASVTLVVGRSGHSFCRRPPLSCQASLCHFRLSLLSLPQ